MSTTIAKSPKKFHKEVENLNNEIIESIKNLKGIDIVKMDLRHLHDAPTDFFIICEAGNQPQIRAIADHVMDQVADRCTEKPYRQEGQKQMQWVLIDYVNVVVHVMTPELRKFYKLEEMWSDGVLTEVGESK